MRLKQGATGRKREVVADGLRVQITLSPSEMAQVRELADEAGWSWARVCRRLALRGLERVQAERAEVAELERLKPAVVEPAGVPAPVLDDPGPG